MSQSPSKSSNGNRNSSFSERSSEKGKVYVPVVEALEAAILSGEMKIGSRLQSEADIAKDFGISLRSVREALHVLETKGLIRRKHGERAVVVRDDIGEFLGTLAVTVRQLFVQKTDYVFQLMDVRQMIEVEAVCRLCRDPSMISREVEEAVLNMHRAVVEDDRTAFDSYDTAFHLGLVHSMNNDILNVFYDNLYGLIDEVIRVASHVPRKTLIQAYDEHDEMYRLIRAQDEDKARAAMARHIGNSAGYLQKTFVKESKKEGQGK